MEHLKVGKEPELNEDGPPNPLAGKVTDTHEDGTKEIIPSDSPVSMNLWGFGLEYMKVLTGGFKTALDKIMEENPMKGEYYIQTPINDQIADGSSTYEVLTSSDKWFGVTYKEDKPGVVKALKALVDKGEYKEGLY